RKRREVVGQVLLAQGQDLGARQALPRLPVVDAINQVEPHEGPPGSGLSGRESAMGGTVAESVKIYTLPGSRQPRATASIAFRPYQSPDRARRCAVLS